MMEKIIKEIAEEYSKIDSVRAVVLSGSRTAKQNDVLSDYDIYIYSDKEVPVDFRTKLAEKYAVSAEINNQYWETGDEWVMEDTGLDFMFRSPDWIESQIENVYEKNYSSIGYTTCFLHNIATSKILFDRENWFSTLQKKISNGYPQTLKNNIIKKNLPLLKDKPSASYSEQIKNAVKRNDYVSINHRISAFLASYFDILFAVNETFHTGEKKLVKFAKSNFKLLPEDFEENLNILFSAPNETKVEILNNMVTKLKKILPDSIK